MKTPYPYIAMPAEVRVRVLLRDSYTCQDCGQQGLPGHAAGRIQVHHIIPYRLCGSHASENLITLCKKCHRLRDREYWLITMREWQARLGYRTTPEDGSRLPTLPRTKRA